MSAGPFLRPARQRAASESSAVESGPPETASRMRRKSEKSEKSAESSRSAIAAPLSAADTLLFRLNRCLHLRRGLRIFLQHGAERGAGRVLLAECRQRLAEPHQRFGCLRALRIFIIDVKKGFGRVVILLALELALAEPIMRL